MPETPSHPGMAAADNEEIFVVLVHPELLGNNPDLAALERTLARTAQRIRVLLCLSERTDQTIAIADALVKTGLDVEVLLGRDIEPPREAKVIFEVPPGTSKRDQNEFALALSDVVLAAHGWESFDTRHLAHMVKGLRKEVTVLGDRVPVIPAVRTTTRHLDPDIPGWHSHWWPHVFGRFEQSIVELLAYNWSGSEEGVTASREKLRRCWSKGWRPASHFAEGWREAAPDRSADHDTSVIVSRFEAMDRSAVYGAYVNRDLVWCEYLGAAAAVLAAVVGELFQGQHVTGVVELLLLVCVASLVFFTRLVSLQDRWTACRLGAEQLRIARMSLPLLVVPSSLAVDTPPAGGSHRKDKAEIGLAALTEVKRAIRAKGLSLVDSDFTLDRATKWVSLIVEGQLTYHKNNRHKLETAESRLQMLSGGLFAAAVVAVLAHFRFHGAEGLLLFTAVAPAFAAALHGAVARLGLVHRAALSADVEQELTRIDKELKQSIKLPAEASWPKLRRLAFEAAEAMELENTSWHSLVRRYRDHL